ncbi:MAG: hypothetical protein LUH47_11190, partial [Clostridiales bacterium]|nr:hypothetical protein [Clostridiales bacterium]
MEEEKDNDTSSEEKHIEFSKILTASIVFMYVLNWAVTWLVYAKTGSISTDLKEYIDVPLNIVMTGY